MLESFTYATFADLLGGVFRLRVDALEPVDLLLIEATDLGASGQGGRVPFSIVFRGPADRVLPQRIYRIEHPDIGAFDLFVVPIGPDGDGMRYEAVFA